jgi:uncharacterized protein YdiU (UPF0061 family)
MRDEALAMSNAVGGEDMTRLRDRLDACESLIALWQSQAQTWESKARLATEHSEKVSNVLAQYRSAISRWAKDLGVISPADELPDVLAQLDFALESMQVDYSALKKEVDEMRQGEAPDIRHFRDLVDRIRELEARFSNREQEWQKIVAQQQKSSQDEVREIKLKYRSLLQNKDGEIRRFKNELDGLLTNIDGLRQAGLLV